ncbi:MAG: ubiquinol-cytochrome c reductase iron-sulfur subunit [Bacteriovoracaceae bacterium]|nr:ubiquinol-cytochrome c reductase iron-sulfur subunit [Bacteriovoracaceae bacterium]
MMSEQRLSLNRREFFGWLSTGWIMFAAASTGMASLIFRFLYPNVVFEPPMDFVAGFPSDYEEGVDERWKNGFGVWIYKNEGKLVAMSNICTHLGCVPTWLPAERKFKCPCHGSGYYPNGVNFEGPAPRPLERYRVFTNADGKIVIDKSKVFRAEKGEWGYPGAYINV